MAKHSYAEACAAFELSQRLDPQYGTQFNLAGCYVAVDKLATAWKLYRELARGDSNLARRSRAAELAADLAARVPKLRVRAEPQLDGLRVLIDTTDVTSLLDVEIPFDTGHYVIKATLPGYKSFRKEVKIEAGMEAREVDIALERAPIQSPEDATGRWSRARYGKISLAGGAGVVGFGLVAGWRALVNRDVSRDRCSLASCPDRPGSQASADRAQVWGDVSTIALVVGAAGVAAGVYLWRTASTPTMTIGAAFAPTTASLVLSGAF
jgi:hypothetical protein